MPGSVSQPGVRCHRCAYRVTPSPLAALSRVADKPCTAVPRFSTRPSVSTGSSVTLQNFTSILLTWILVTRPDLSGDLSRNPGTLRPFERI